MCDTQDREWELISKEYDCLREEILNKMEKQYQIIGLGVGGISVLLGFIFGAEGHHELFLFLPLSVIACILLFDAERSAILNAGEYIRMIENDTFKSGKMVGWEEWLAGSKERGIYMHFEIASLLMLILLNIISIYGIYKYLDFSLSSAYLRGILDPKSIKIVITVVYLLIGVFTPFIYLVSKWRDKSEFLFSIDGDDIENELDKGVVPKKLTSKLYEKNIFISDKVRINKETKWTITDQKSAYTLSKHGGKLKLSKK